MGSGYVVYLVVIDMLAQVPYTQGRASHLRQPPAPDRLPSWRLSIFNIYVYLHHSTCDLTLRI